MSSAQSALIYIIQAVSFLFITIVLLRFWMQAARVNFYDPMAQFVVKATEPLIRPLRTIFPDLGRYSMSAVVLATLLIVLQVLVISTIVGTIPDPLTLLGRSAYLLLDSAFQLIFFVLIGLAIISWISPQGNPVYATLSALTAPLLAPIRRLLPAMGGLDLSPLVAIIGIQALRILFGM